MGLPGGKVKNDLMRISSGQWLICIIFGMAGLGLVAIVVLQLGTAGTVKPNPYELTEEEEELLAQDEMRIKDGKFPAREMEEPGIDNPVAYAVHEVTIADDSPVLGLEIDGKCRAYLASGMAENTNRHIVHDKLGGNAITVTHCDRSACSRVFLRKDVSVDNFQMGGWSGKEMWLLIRNKRYLHTSKKLPLEDYPFEVTTWGEWKTAHPETDIYLGP